MCECVCVYICDEKEEEKREKKTLLFNSKRHNGIIIIIINDIFMLATMGLLPMAYIFDLLMVEFQHTKIQLVCVNQKHSVKHQNALPQPQ